ncbi:rhodanese-like domain-containing protein [Agromyces sp. LHK192]|uniref:rhodanese-like domain-containing protein n=1 Tax=Agromyces sp. LHK192 TaxID=2498704 RepID=UPI000FD717F3|nr:rhodanese-like domain-containing protein [Agromyces sp. LHK192]
MQHITPEEAHAAEDSILLDVREPTELEQARIDGALHIPLGELVARLDEVPRDRPVHVICHVGGRSAQAAQFLEGQGVEVANIEGGIVAWYRAGLPVVLGDET